MTSFMAMTTLGVAFVLLVISPTVLTSPLAETQKTSDASPTEQNDVASEDTDDCSAQESKICFTKGCVKAANTILQNMDAEMDPCEDFYSFACGTFTKTKVVPDDETSLSQFTIIRDQVQSRLRKLLEANVAKDDSFAIQQTKNLYASCVDTETIEHLGLKPLEDVLAKMGGWPVVEGESWKADDFSWTDAIQRNREFGYSVDYIIDFSVITDPKNSSHRIINFDQATLGLPSGVLLRGIENHIVQAYYHYMLDMAHMLGTDDMEEAEEELEESLLFEIQLANISLAAEDRMNTTKLYNKMTLEDLGKLMPEVDWVNYTNNILRAAGHQVTEKEPVIVYVPDFVEKLSTLLKKTDKKVLANYMIWRVVYASAGMLNEEARYIQSHFEETVSGITDRRPRWKECLGKTMNKLDLAVGSLYVRNYFNTSSQKATLELMESIHEQFNKALDKVEWMDEKTREEAKKKSKAIKYNIGYPEELLNDTTLAEIYGEVSMDRDHFFENHFNLTVGGHNYALGKLRDEVNKNDWRKHGSAAASHAFYNHLENSMQFPAGALQGILYDYDRPQYMNYGGIGYMIGHELVHGFDDRGRHFNAEGDFAEWWEPETKEGFLESAKCMIEQYSNVTVPETGLKINGRLTLTENIADNGGIKQARLAYESYEKEKGEEPALPGLQRYSNKQMFWMAAANAFCSVAEPETMKMQTLAGWYSPPMAIVNVVFSNQEEFSKDWQCSKGAGMNPTHQCTVW